MSVSADATPAKTAANQAAEDPQFGRMNDPTGAAFIKGPCGEEMEFYLYIVNDVIVEAKYYTDGCDDTRVSGAAAARLAQGRTVMDALAINPRQIIDAEANLLGAHRHCAILAVSTLFRAIADYLLKA